MRRCLALIPAVFLAAAGGCGCGTTVPSKVPVPNQPPSAVPADGPGGKAPRVSPPPLMKP